jgi:regulator of protease activity HflC (stomatin/prohibitin superfamily)
MQLKNQFGNNFNNNEGGTKLNKTKLALGLSGFGLILLVVLAFQFIGFVEIKGHQAAVVEKFYGEDKGVQDHILKTGRHFYIPMLEKPYVYNVGTSNFIMGEPSHYSGKGQDYVDFPALVIKCGGRGFEQPATFSITLQYQLDVSKLKQLHVRAQNQYEDRIIKPALTNIIKSLTVTQHVLDFYTGEGYNNLQRAVEEAIKNDPDMGGIGIVVNTFVIDQIDLDTKFESEIQARQLATQQKLKEDELAKAAQAAALKEKAIAQADKEKRIVAAEADKQEKIKAAEAQNESRILAAKAEAEEIKQKATAERYRKEQDAKGLLAQGLAQAKVDKARKMSRYDGVSGKRQAAVEIAKYQVEKFQNFNPKGVVTEKTFLSINSEAKSPIVTIEANN